MWLVMSRNQDDSNLREKTKISYSLREWQEAAFLEHTKIILADTSYNNIQKITLDGSKVVYLIPESFYSSKAKEIQVQVDK